MEELKELRQRMESERPDSWEQLPDLALYMDQLISYMPRQLIHFSGTDALTAAMVNNYIKDGLLPRAEGKRYGREHLAFLTAICAMKTVLSVKEMGALLGCSAARTDAEPLYGFFLERLDGALNTAAQRLDTAKEMEEKDLAALALTLALNSYAEKLACQQVLDLLRAKAPATPEKETKKKK